MTNPILSAFLFLVFTTNSMAQQHVDVQGIGSQLAITTGEIGSESGVFHGRSLAIASPDRRLRAYAEITASLGDEKKEYRRLEWSLFVSYDYGASFDRLIIPNSAELTGAEFRLLGWTSDSTRLLSVMTSWAGDYTVNYPVVFNAANKTKRVFDLESVVKRATRTKCELVYAEPSGWLGPDEFAFNAYSSEQDLAPNEKPCFEDSMWSIKVPAGKVRRLNPRASARNYGEISWADSSPSIIPQQGAGFNVLNSLCERLLSNTVKSDISTPQILVIWERCGGGHADDPLRKEDFPQHHVVIVKQGEGDNLKPLATVDNLANESQYFFDKVLTTKFDGKGQQVFISARFYGTNEGHAFCVLDRLGDKYSCWETPDLNAMAKKALTENEDLCCSDWATRITPQSIEMDRPVFDKITGRKKRSLRLRLIPRDGSFEAEVLQKS